MTETPAKALAQFEDLKLAAEAFRVAMVQSGALIHVRPDLYFEELRALERALNPINYRSLDAPRGREEIARIIDETPFLGVYDLPLRKAEALRKADAILALAPAPADGVREAIATAILSVVSSRDDLGYTHFIEIRDAIFAALAAQDTADRTGAQISELDEASNACLELAAEHGFATGHGDTVADMIREFSAQIKTPARTTADRTGAETTPDNDIDLAEVLAQFTNLIMNERVNSYNEGVDAVRTIAARTEGREALEALSMWVTTERQKYRVAGGMPAGGFANMTPIEIALAKVEGEINRRAALSLSDGEKG